MQPCALLARREVEVGVRPASRPQILRAVVAGRRQPVAPRELTRIADAQSPLLGRVDEEQPAKRPERLPTETLVALLIEEQHRAPTIRGFGRDHEPREPGPDDD